MIVFHKTSNTNLNLKPVLSAFTMTEVVKKVLEKTYQLPVKTCIINY